MITNSRGDNMPTTMKAIIKDKREPGFSYGEMPIPALGPRDVLIKIKAAAICGSDINFYKYEKSFCESFIKKFPFVAGHECSGVVEAVGPAVTYVKPGDRVSCDSHVPCGHCRQCQIGRSNLCTNMGHFGHNMDGCFSQYAVTSEANVRKVPDELSFDAAALLEPFGVVIRPVLESGVPGSVVCVSGCGPIGLFAIALAKAVGAYKIFAIGNKEWRLNKAGEMGADVLINSTEHPDFSKILKENTIDGVEVFLECSGNVDVINEALLSVCRGGTICSIGNPKKDLVVTDPYKKLTLSEIVFKGTFGRTMFATFEKAERFLMKGAVDLDKIITHRFSMKDYEEAFKVAMSGQCGKVLLYPEE